MRRRRRALRRERQVYGDIADLAHAGVGGPQPSPVSISIPCLWSQSADHGACQRRCLAREGRQSSDVRPAGCWKVAPGVSTSFAALYPTGFGSTFMLGGSMGTSAPSRSVRRLFGQFRPHAVIGMDGFNGSAISLADFRGLAAMSKAPKVGSPEGFHFAFFSCCAPRILSALRSCKSTSSVAL